MKIVKKSERLIIHNIHHFINYNKSLNFNNWYKPIDILILNKHI